MENLVKKVDTVKIASLSLIGYMGFGFVGYADGVLMILVGYSLVMFASFHFGVLYKRKKTIS